MIVLLFNIVRTFSILLMCTKFLTFVQELLLILTFATLRNLIFTLIAMLEYRLISYFSCSVTVVILFYLLLENDLEGSFCWFFFIFFYL